MNKEDKVSFDGAIEREKYFLEKEISEFNNSLLIIECDITAIQNDIKKCRSIRGKVEIKKKILHIQSTVQSIIDNVKPASNIKLKGLSDKNLSIKMGEDWRFIEDYKLRHKLSCERIQKTLSNLIDRVDEIDFVDKKTQLTTPSSLFSLSKNESTYLYNELIKNRLLSEKTNKGDFDYVFCGGVCPDDFRPLGWETSKQGLSELVILLSGTKSVPRKIKTAAQDLFTIKGELIRGLNNPAKDSHSNDRITLETITDKMKREKSRPL